MTLVRHLWSLVLLCACVTACANNASTDSAQDTWSSTSPSTTSSLDTQVTSSPTAATSSSTSPSTTSSPEPTSDTTSTEPPPPISTGKAPPEMVDDRGTSAIPKAAQELLPGELFHGLTDRGEQPFEVLIAKQDAILAGEKSYIRGSLHCLGPSREMEEGLLPGVCEVSQVEMSVWPVDAEQAVRQVLLGVADSGEFGALFQVDAANEYAISLDIATVAGDTYRYPPGNDSLSLSVFSRSGNAMLVDEARLNGGVRAADKAVELSYGDGPDEVGRVAGEGRAALGPSSFVIDDGGAVYIADWLHGRNLIVSDGKVIGEQRTGVERPYDLARAAGRTFVATLGLDAEVLVVDDSGVVTHSDVVPFGVAYRIDTEPGADGVSVVVGPSTRVTADPNSAGVTDYRQRLALDAEAGVIRASLSNNRLLVALDGAASAYSMPDGWRLGSLFFDAERADGGHVVAMVATNDASSFTLVASIDAAGDVTGVHLLPMPTIDQDVFPAGARWDQTREAVVVNVSNANAFRLEWYDL